MLKMFASLWLISRWNKVSIRFNYWKLINIEVTNFNTIDATPAIIKDDYTYLKKSHKTLLMFRRQTSDIKQELRH